MMLDAVHTVRNMNKSTTNRKREYDMLSLEAPNGLTFNPGLQQYLNIRYDDFGKPVGRSVMGNKDDFHR